jgi:hypothetical protein
METASSGSLFTSLLPMILMTIPFIILNGIISKRKGKSQIKYILLSFIPLLGLCLTIYLVSFLDKDVQDKINKIYEKIS